MTQREISLQKTTIGNEQRRKKYVQVRGIEINSKNYLPVDMNVTINIHKSEKLPVWYLNKLFDNVNIA